MIKFIKAEPLSLTTNESINVSLPSPPITSKVTLDVDHIINTTIIITVVSIICIGTILVFGKSVISYIETFINKQEETIYTSYGVSCEHCKISSV